jgi:class 3 adenylate cyclase
MAGEAMKCRKCQTELPDGAKFCLECGANLHDAHPVLKPLPEPTKTRLTPEPERKHVTALFSDLTGCTSMTEKLDPEKVKEITGRIFTGVKQIVTKYEGFIERFASHRGIFAASCPRLGQEFACWVVVVIAQEPFDRQGKQGKQRFTSPGSLFPTGLPSRVRKGVAPIA